MMRAVSQLRNIASKAETQPANLFIFKDRIVWASTGFTGAETTRPACALLIGAYGPLDVMVARRQKMSVRAILIGPNVARALNAEAAGFYSLTLDPAHKAARYLRDKVLQGRRALDLSHQLDARQLTAVADAIERKQSCAESLRLSDSLMRQLFPGLRVAAPVDPRVLLAARYLREQLPTRVNMRQLGAYCHLSFGRLTHLFSEELGISARTYLRWAKLRKAVELFAYNYSIAEIAAAIGFSDSAHLNRVLKVYYSVKPSFVADRNRVRVFSCDKTSGQPEFAR